MKIRKYLRFVAEDSDKINTVTPVTSFEFRPNSVRWETYINKIHDENKHNKLKKRMLSMSFTFSFPVQNNKGSY
jgi:hexokinase